MLRKKDLSVGRGGRAEVGGSDEEFLCPENDNFVISQIFYYYVSSILIPGGDLSKN